MNHYIQTFKASLTTERKQLIIGIAVVLSLVALAAAVALIVHNSGPKISYQPVKACDLLTRTKAQDLLGERVISINTEEPVISGNVATSKCSYTDDNIDDTKMVVAAIAVRSGINDEGVQQNKTEFTAGKPNKGIEDVKNIGDSAYFNKEVGQLNVLDGKKWIIVSYGVGALPQANSVEKATTLANKILR